VSEEQGSRFEAEEALVHHADAHRPGPGHLHHPADPNAGVVRGRLGRHAVLAAVLSTAVTVAGVVLLALAIGRQ
jgi:hypothetical protein